MKCIEFSLSIGKWKFFEFSAATAEKSKHSKTVENQIFEIADKFNMILIKHRKNLNEFSMKPVTAHSECKSLKKRIPKSCNMKLLIQMFRIFLFVVGVLNLYFFTAIYFFIHLSKKILNLCEICSEFIELDF